MFKQIKFLWFATYKPINNVKQILNTNIWNREALAKASLMKTLHDYNLIKMVGQEELESSTFAVSERRSNQLNYWPGKDENPFYSTDTETEKTQFYEEMCRQSLDLSVRENGFSIKEVIQPHLPVLLPCYDLTPITNPTVGGVLLR